MYIDIGGCKGRKNYPLSIREQWRTLDINPSADIVHDINSESPIPLCDGVVKAYYASHVLEHVRMERMQHIMSEMHRTLCKGGTIRIVVPNLSEGIRWYCSDDERLFHGGPTVHSSAPKTALGQLLCWIYTPDKGRYSGHYMGFDRATIEWYLTHAGFDQVKHLNYNECDPTYVGMDRKRYKGWCLFVEAVKS